MFSIFMAIRCQPCEECSLQACLESFTEGRAALAVSRSCYSECSEESPAAHLARRGTRDRSIPAKKFNLCHREERSLRRGDLLGFGNNSLNG
jgi:hypothetical protein